MMTAAAMLSHECGRWGDRDDDDGEEEVVEVDNNDETVAASGGGDRQNGGFKEDGNANSSKWMEGGGDNEINEYLPPSPPRPSPASPVGGGDARRQRQRLGRHGGAAQVDAGRRQRQL